MIVLYPVFLCDFCFLSFTSLRLCALYRLNEQFEKLLFCNFFFEIVKIYNAIFEIQIKVA